MLGRNFKLSRNVVADQFSEKAVIFVVHQIVKTDSGADKYLFDFWYLLDLFDQLDILFVICFKIFARCGRKAFSVRANTAFKLFIAGWIAEISCRTANVVDITLEIRHLRDDLSLADYAFNAS